MSAHTPGPWKAGGRNSSGIVTANSAIGTHSDAENVQAYGAPLVCESIASAANARLISAAPDLLAALKRMVCDFGGADDTMDGFSVIAAARAAIAKATGA